MSYESEVDDKLAAGMIAQAKAESKRLFDNMDSDGNPPMFVNGDRVYVTCNKMYATIIRQQKSYDGPGYWIWGNVELMYDDGITGVSNSWQCELC
jgi:hypothetical protein